MPAITQPRDMADFSILTGLVRHILDSATLLNLPSEKIIAMAEIPSALLTDPGSRMPINFLYRLMRSTIEVSGDELIFLHLSQVSGASGFGVIGYLRQACHTLQQALELTIRYESLVCDFGTTSVKHLPGRVIWCWDCRSGNPWFDAHCTDYALASWLNIQESMSRRQLERPVLAAHFCHAPPGRKEHVKEYERIFGCPCYFNQAESGLVLKSSSLFMPLSHPDSALQETLELHARQLLNQRRLAVGSFIEQARAQLTRQLHQGHASRELLAEALGLSGRHLHRQLEAAGSGYRQLLDEVRLEMAKISLHDPELTIESISQSLCFSESSSFVRWFRGLAGVTPAEYRRRGQGAGKPPLPS